MKIVLTFLLITSLILLGLYIGLLQFGGNSGRVLGTEVIALLILGVFMIFAICSVAVGVIVFLPNKSIKVKVFTTIILAMIVIFLTIKLTVLNHFIFD
ncbi:hypothetical protein D1818_15005 [Aquimarina sp. BL5]|nr:hypothetical protein D1818_15005 [Aquimarina sp. BL5]RKN05173.1 hypothetical protein D7036_11045 [Aquimarina sp. BL5]